MARPIRQYGIAVTDAVSEGVAAPRPKGQGIIRRSCLGVQAEVMPRTTKITAGMCCLAKRPGEHPSICMARNLVSAEARIAAKRRRRPAEIGLRQQHHGARDEPSRRLRRSGGKLALR